MIRNRLGHLTTIYGLRRRGLYVAASATLDTAEGLSFGARCSINRGSMISIAGGRLSLGDDVSFGDYNNLRASGSSITVGSRVLAAQFVSLIAANHRVTDENVPIWDEHADGPEGITIGDDCWLGVGSIVLPGVVLGDRCVVAAGAVVSKAFPSGSTLVGVPARALR